MDYSGKRVLIVGLARSGAAAARLLVQHGALVTVNDSKSREKLPEGDKLGWGIRTVWGVGYKFEAK